MCFKILHVFLQINSLIIDPYKVKGMIDAITMDGFKRGSSEFMRHGSGFEYVIHFSHPVSFSVTNLQEKIEDLEDYVEYTWVDDPDEDALNYALDCHTNNLPLDSDKYEFPY